MMRRGMRRAFVAGVAVAECVLVGVGWVLVWLGLDADPESEWPGGMGSHWW